MAKLKNAAAIIGTYILLAMFMPLLLFLSLIYEDTGDLAVDSYRYSDF